MSYAHTAATADVLRKIAADDMPTTDPLAAEVNEIGMEVLTGFTLADAIRAGSKHTTQVYAWGGGENACALSAAYLAALSRGYVEPTA